MFLFIYCHFLSSDVYFDFYIASAASFSLSVTSFSNHLQLTYLSLCLKDFLKSTYIWILIFNPISQSQVFIWYISICKSEVAFDMAQFKHIILLLVFSLCPVFPFQPSFKYMSIFRILFHLLALYCICIIFSGFLVLIIYIINFPNYWKLRFCHLKWNIETLYNQRSLYPPSFIL